jgi:hypothetical protein
LHKAKLRAGSVAPVVRHLPRMCEALGSTSKEKKQERSSRCALLNRLYGTCTEGNIIQPFEIFTHIES